MKKVPQVMGSAESPLPGRRYPRSGPKREVRMAACAFSRAHTPRRACACQLGTGRDWGTCLPANQLVPACLSHCPSSCCCSALLLPCAHVWLFLVNIGCGESQAIPVFAPAACTHVRKRHPSVCPVRGNQSLRVFAHCPYNQPLSPTSKQWYSEQARHCLCGQHQPRPTTSLVRRPGAVHTLTPYLFRFSSRTSPTFDDTFTTSAR